MWNDNHRKKSIQAKKLKALERLKNNKNKHLSNHALKKILITAGREYKCSECGLTEWNNVQLTLHLEHINGDSFDNDLENLKFLCPNCHSITSTYCGKNKNNGKKKVSDEVLINALKNNTNIRQALIEVGLSPRGGNYSRALRLKGT